MRSFLLAGISVCLIFVAMPAQADVVAEIDKSRQQMKVYVNGFKKHSWKVSTARRGYRTPVGSWRPKWLARMHYSKKYHNSPMPHSIFFLGGYAIHGSYAIKRLGRTASHGCIRLHPDNAKRLFSLVRKYGMKNTKIVITNGTKKSRAVKNKKRNWKRSFGLISYRSDTISIMRPTISF